MKFLVKLWRGLFPDRNILPPPAYEARDKGLEVFRRIIDRREA
jgi:hypothetical protein